MKPYESDTSKEEQVRRMFDTIAPRYDLLNHLLSLGIDRSWRRKAVRETVAGNPAKVLDLATGTADLAIALARSLPRATIQGVDLSPEMVAVGKRKVFEKELAERIALSVGDATALPFEDASFDAVTVAFGVRNFEDLEKGLAEMRRILRPGGRMVVLEFSVPKDKFFAALYRFYFHTLLPRIGGAISGDSKAYKYLPGSVDEFPAPDIFSQMILSRGFAEVKAKRLTRGVAYIHTAVLGE